MKLTFSNVGRFVEMTEVETGVWKTKEAYTLTAGTEFKVRKGLSWDEAWPTANFVVPNTLDDAV